MRIYFGLSRKIKLTTIIKILGVVFSIFFLNSCVVHAESFSVIQKWSYCPLNANNYESTGCILRDSQYISDYASVNGFNNVTKVFTANYPTGKTGTESHSEMYKYGGTSGCSTTGTISFNIDVILNDVQELLPNNTLNYSAWGSPVVPTTRSSYTRSLSFNNYYSWLGNSSSTDSENKLGVAVAKNDYQFNYSQCSFVSYGTNKSVRFRCNIASGPSGYYIRINESNLSGVMIDNYASSDLPTIVSGIKISMINDPCLTYSNDSSGVVDAITDQTEDIMQGFQDIIDNNNTNTQSITDSINHNSGEIVDNLEDIKDILEDISNNGGNGNESCTKLYEKDFNNPGLLYQSNGIVNYNENYITSGFIALERVKNFSASNYTMCFYNSDKIKISCTNNFSGSLPSNTVYLRVSFPKNQPNYFIETCGTGQVFNSNGIEKYLSQINEMESPITDLLTLPITFVQGVIDGVSVSSCSPYNINVSLPGATRNNNTTWSFPCLDTIYYSNDTNTQNIVNIIDMIFCFVLVYGICLGAIRFYEDLSSLKDTFDQQYKGGGK